MTYREEILQQALALPLADRAFVAAALEESLSAASPLAADAAPAAGSDPASTAELLAEFQRRSADHKNGAMTARTAEEVIADFRDTPVGGQANSI